VQADRLLFLNKLDYDHRVVWRARSEGESTVSRGGLKRGFLLIFEGIEGCGKTSQLHRLARRLRALGYQVVETREPGGAPISEQIRTILLDPKNRGMEARCELLLYLASRAQHLAETIRPALEKGAVVLCDRFADATTAYQGYGRGLGPAVVARLNRFATWMSRWRSASLASARPAALTASTGSMPRSTKPCGGAISASPDRTRAACAWWTVPPPKTSWRVRSTGLCSPGCGRGGPP